MESNCLEVDHLRREALRFLLARHSISPKYLGQPGPTDEESRTVALAALRAPDHNKLVPFRFVVARDEGLHKLADLFVDYGKRRGKSGPDLEAERPRALQAPVVIAVIAKIDLQNPDVPVHEQWACVGGAISYAVLALHVMGYGAKMLSGARAADPAISSAYCKDGETLVGWISAGTAKTGPKARDPVDPDQVLSTF
ncbi:MAG TPA: nitroreductase [Burkholderiaceae bacterium]|nr:nitroreductase [Burkholderiaceae bacterium]